jgi:hypothetical protein
MDTTHLRTTNIRPENAVLVYSLDLTKNKAAVWAMNGASLPLSIGCFWWVRLFYSLP